MFLNAGIEPVEHLGNDGVQGHHGFGGIGRTTNSTELELVPGESKGRSAVAVGVVAKDFRNFGNAQVNAFPVSVAKILARRQVFEFIEGFGELLSDERRHDSRRSLVSAQAQIVACRSNASAKQLFVFVHGLEDNGQHGHKPEVFLRCFPGRQEVFACIGGHRPVVVFSAAVNTIIRLLMEKYFEMVLARNLVQEVHQELIVVNSHIDFLKNRSTFELAGRHFVMPGL